MPVQITKGWLEQHAATRINDTSHAWTRAQLKVLDITWPPVRGWKRSTGG